MTRRFVARPLGQDFLHQFLGEKLRVRQFHRVEFLARAHIEEADVLSPLSVDPTIRAVRFAWRDQPHRWRRCVQRLPRRPNFHCERKRRRAFLPGESATAATADVIFAEERALRPGKRSSSSRMVMLGSIVATEVMDHVMVRLRGGSANRATVQGGPGGPIHLYRRAIGSIAPTSTIFAGSCEQLDHSL